jgi:8-oxo-dGTP pyrophosphatase MutT (NUDIX family)
VQTYDIKDAVRRAMGGYTPQRIEDDPLVPAAAVLLLLFEHESRPHVVFQKRTDRVRDHKGQISFPGGAMDPGDEHLLYTALRETHEEIGVQPDHVEVLGQLDDMVTVSNFRVTPFVGWLSHYPYPWRFSDEEVAYLLEVPLDHLRDPATLIPDRRLINGREYVFSSYQFGQDLIWGATARMLGNFLDILESIEG